MATFDSGAFDTGSFDTGSFDLNAAAGAAVFLGPNISNLAFVIGVPITPIDFSSLFDGPGLTFAFVGAPPTGLSLSSGGVLSGTPTVEAVTSGLKIRATDNVAGTADSNAFSITIADVVLSHNPRWFPMPLALRLSWLRRYAGLEAAARAEAAGSALWARPRSYSNIQIDVHSVPGYPRPNWPVPGG